MAFSDVRDIYRRSRKERDDFWTDRVSRPPAAVIVWLVKDTSVTPNQITVASLAVALAAAAAFAAWRGYLGLLVAGLILQISYVLDCADGQLARLRGTASPLGAGLDFVTDAIKAPAILAAVTLRLWRQHDRALYVALGLVGLVALTAGLSLTTFVRGPHYPATNARPRRGALVRGLEWLGRTAIQYPRYMLLACIVGLVEIYFFAYVAANALYAGRTMLGVIRKIV